MSYIVKIHPDCALQLGSCINVCEKLLRCDRPIVGDEMFVWTAESSGGSGLEASGIVENVDSGGVLTLRINRKVDCYVLGKTELAPFRPPPWIKPIAKLSRVLHYYSPRNVSKLDDETVNFVNNLIEQR